MRSPPLSRLALFAALAVSSLSLHAACARSVGSDLGADSQGLFRDAGDAAAQNKCISTECPAPFATCPGEGLCMTNLTNDVDHCGACNRPCPANPANAG